MIAITGKPGSGKTHLSKILESKGYAVFNVDKYVNFLYEFNNDGYNLIKKNYGSEFVNEFSVNKNLLKELILKDKREIKRLNKIIHPLIDLKLKKSNFDFVEIPVLGSEYINYNFDKVIYLNCSDRTSLYRMTKINNISEKDSIFYLSLWNELKRKDNVFIIENDKELTNTDIKKVVELI